MNPSDVVNGDDERFALLLARYSEALNAGRNADPKLDPSLSPELRQRLQRALSCLRRLQHFRDAPTLVMSVTQLMEQGSTLHDDDLIGGQVGRFRIVRTLGQGGGGLVFLAFDPDLHREVALKVPHLPALLAPDLRRRFLREARAAARLDHPNLVPVHEVGESNGVCFIVSAYCRGGSLAQWLAARTTPVPARQVAHLVAVLADAVEYVHDHGIYHRDLKPGNILLDIAEAPRGGELGFTPRLTDFGLAKQMDSDSSQTANGAVIGTPSYMAPEQFDGRRDHIGRRTDVYGLGAVLYELLTGRPPFKGATDSQTLDQVLFQAPVRPGRIRSGVPRDLEIICLKCLEKLPQHRYAGAAELAADLRRFVADEPIQARPPRGTEKLIKWLRRQPWAMACGTVLCLAVLTLLLGGLWLHQTKRTHDANLAAAAQQQKEREEAIRQKEKHLLQFQYAEDMALAGQHASKGRLDELADKLQTYRRFPGVEDPRSFGWYYLWSQASILRCRMRSPDSSLWSVAFSPDGKICATGHQDGVLRLWDRVGGQMLQALAGHKVPVYSLAFSPDGKYLISGGGIQTDRRRDGELLLWDTVTWKIQPIAGKPSATVDSLAYSSDGSTVATASGNNTVQLWEMPSGMLRNTISFPFGVAILSVAFRPNSTVLSVGRDDGYISLCDAANGRILESRQGHQGMVWSVAYSQANDVLVSGAYDRCVRLWGQNANLSLGDYRHDNKVYSVALSPDGRTAASISQDGIVKLWDVKSQRERFLLAMPPGFGRCLAFSPDGKDLAVGSSDGRLWICDVSRSTEPTSWLGHRVGPLPREAWAVAFSPDGKTLASAGDDNHIHLWEPATGRRLKSLPRQESLVTCIAFSPNGKLLASGSFEKEANVKLWSVATGEEVSTLSGHTKIVDVLAFAPNGESLATAGRDGVVRLWDLTTQKNHSILTGCHVGSLAFSLDGRSLALAGENGSVFLWDVKEQAMRWVVSPHPKGHVAVAFAPDGKTLATGDKDGVVCFFDSATGQSQNKSQSRGHTVNCLAFSPDGKTLASAGFDKKVKLWQVSTSRELLTLPEQKDRVRWLAFSPDGTMLATAGHDGVLTIYRAPADDGGTSNSASIRTLPSSTTDSRRLP
ncbi:MAG TPA: protein kinase [Gemmataceae bacterium]|jgi:WD40 repeat protein/serine/threonine protein kinase